METIFDRLDKITFEHPEVQTKFNYLKAFYSADYKRFTEEIAKDGNYNDRQIYINLCNMLLESLPVLDKIYKESVVIDVAYGEYFSKEEETLKRIKSRFTPAQV